MTAAKNWRSHIWYPSRRLKIAVHLPWSFSNALTLSVSPAGDASIALPASASSFLQASQISSECGRLILVTMESKTSVKRLRHHCASTMMSASGPVSYPATVTRTEFVLTSAPVSVVNVAPTVISPGVPALSSRTMSLLCPNCSEPRESLLTPECSSRTQPARTPGPCSSRPFSSTLRHTSCAMVARSVPSKFAIASGSIWASWTKE
mmetsp:Transcript_114764/g.357442  ORF Transcript_114764/g.357442 Transcript_114764/m.357442 type:complete len:207 (-) Transcript_114764:688-1308(-)